MKEEMLTFLHIRRDINRRDKTWVFFKIASKIMSLFYNEACDAVLNELVSDLNPGSR